MSVGVKIKSIRKKCLLSQNEFANQLGVSFSTVNRWENEKTVPNYNALRKIKEFCNIKQLPFDIDQNENTCGD